MSTPNLPAPDHSNNLDEIRFIREEIKFQHSLIGTRMSWFVSSQAFLVTPFAICVANQLSRTFLLALVGIPCLGIILSLLIVPSIQQAIKRIEEEHALLRKYSTEHLLGPFDPAAHKKSLEFAAWVPWVFVIFWLLVILFGFAVMFK